MDGVHLQCNYRHLLYVYNFFVLIKSGVSLLERGRRSITYTPLAPYKTTTLSNVGKCGGARRLAHG
jgi:hypothetical protein